MSKAYSNNPDLNAARAGLRATDEGVTIAKAGWRPQIAAFGQKTTTQYNLDLNGVTTTVNPITGEVKRHIDITGFNTSEVCITITQQVFDGFQTLNNVRAAEATVYSQRASLKATEIQILLSSAQAFANIARDQEVVSIRKQNVAFLHKQVNSTRARTDEARQRLPMSTSRSRNSLKGNGFFQMLNRS
jgi:outer membrane protein